MGSSKVLITGGTGLLGKSLIDLVDDSCEITATFIGNYGIENKKNVKYLKLDVLDYGGYKKLFHNFKPDAVIHTASIGSPDFAEKNKDITWQINVVGTSNIISLCEEYNASFLYISSNGIYDGGSAPYAEDDIPAPINYYGMTKLEGESLTTKAKVEKAIIRPILMYGWNHDFERQNIVTMALSKLSKNEKVHVYDDVFVNALYSDNCAEAIWVILKTSKYGIYNIAGSERTSIYGLLNKCAVVFDMDPSLIIPVKQGYFNELVMRPKDTSYNTQKMEQVLKVRALSLIQGLTKMKEKKKVY